MQIYEMQRKLLTFGLRALFLGAIMMPDTALARENEPAETANCTDPRHRHNVVRPAVEPAPIRKAEKLRVRRILI